MSILHITDIDEYLKFISCKSCIIKFTADWCSPCKKMAPIFESLATNNSITFIEIDIEETATITHKECVQSIPLFLFYHNGSKYEDLTICGSNSNGLISNFQIFISRTSKIIEDNITINDNFQEININNEQIKDNVQQSDADFQELDIDELQEPEDYIDDFQDNIEELDTDVLQEPEDYIDDFQDNIEELDTDVLQELEDYIDDFQDNIEELDTDDLQEPEDYIKESEDCAKKLDTDVVQELEHYIKELDI